MNRSSHRFHWLAVLAGLLLLLPVLPSTNARAQDSTLNFGILLGGSGSERIYSVVRAPSGDFFIAGETDSTDLPATDGVVDRSSSMGEGFIARFSAMGDLRWLTYLGGNGQDAIYDLALGDGALYAAGVTSSTDFPGGRPVSGDRDGFVAAVSLDGTALYYSTLLGGSDQDSAYAVAVENGMAAVTGITYSSDFSSSSYFGGGDAFLARVDAAGVPQSILLFGGRAVDAGFDVAIQNGDTWVAGQTFSFNFPIRGLKGMQDGFVLRTDSAGTRKWGTLVGGSGEDNIQGIALSADGNVYVTGLSTSADFPAGSQLFGASDTYISILSADGSLDQSVRIGGTGSELGRTVALDGAGRVILCGLTASSDFPVSSNAAQSQNGDGEDIFIAGFSAETLAAPDQYYASFFGGGGKEACNGLAAVGAGTALIVGDSDSGGAPEAFSVIGSGGSRNGIILQMALLPPGAAPLPTATVPAVTSIPEPVLTPTIPLLYTPPPAPSIIEVGPTTADSTAIAATGLPEDTPTSTALVPLEKTQETKGASGTELAPIADQNSGRNGLWWGVGIIGVMILAGGAWFFVTKKRK